MKSVEIGKVDKLDSSNGNYKGISLTAHLQHTSVNTAFVGLPIDWSQVIVTCKLRKADGMEHIICQDPALPLILSSNYFDGQFQAASPVGSPAQIVYQAHGAAAKAILKQTARIDFGEVVNLAPGDRIYLEVNCLPSAVLSTVDTAASAIYFDFEEGIGNGFALPAFKVETFKGGEASLPLGAGHGVKEITFVNSDKSGIILTNQTLLSVSLSSDKLSRTEQYDEILKRRYDQFQSIADADLRHQCFRILDVDRESYSPMNDLLLNNVNLQISLIGANITAAKNWIVIRKLVKNVQVAEEAAKRYGKHEAQNVANYI